MSKHLYLAESSDAQPSESYLYLEDDVLIPRRELTSRNGSTAAWALFGDLYGDAVFDLDAAEALARECECLAADAEPTIAVWLRTIAAFAAAASRQAKRVLAVAD